MRASKWKAKSSTPWKLILTLLIVCVFLNNARADDSLLKLSSLSRVFLDKEFDLKHFEPTEVTVVNVRHLFIEHSGGAIVMVSVSNKDKKTSKEVVCDAQGSNTICMLWSGQDTSFGFQDEYQVRIMSAKYFLGDAPSKYKIRMVGGDFLEYDHLTDAFIEPNKAKVINVLLNLENAKPDKVGRLQIGALQRYSQSLKHPESLKIYAKKQNTPVLPSVYFAHAVSQAGIGALVSFDKTDPEFCMGKKGCKIAIRIETKHIKVFSLATILEESPIKLSFAYTGPYYDKLKKGKEAIYQFNELNRDPKASYQFTLVPIEGNPDMIITSSAGQTWKTSADSSESILLTPKDLNKIEKETSGAMFLKVKIVSKFGPSLYMMKFQAQTYIKPELVPNSPVTGEALNGQIVNYEFFPPVEVPEKVEVFLKMTTLQGDPDIFVKSCDSRFDKCEITKDDVVNKEKLQKKSGQKSLFLFSSMSSGDDNLYFEFNCRTSKPKYKNYHFLTKKRQPIFETKTCRFAIAVVGKPSSIQTLSKYTLEIKGGRTHHTLKQNTPKALDLPPSSKYYYYMDVKPQGTLSDMSTFFKINFLVISGRADVYLSTKFKYPTELNSDVTSTIGAHDELKGENKLYKLQLRRESNELSRIYIGIEPKSYLYGNMQGTLTSDPDTPVSQLPDVVEIEANKQTIYSIPAKRDSKQWFHIDIDMNLAQNKKQNEFSFDLTGIKGSFNWGVYATKEENDLPQSVEECQWIDKNRDGKIVIKKDDKNLAGIKRFYVLVKPRVNGDSSQLLTYAISFSYSSDSRNFHNILSGIPSVIRSLHQCKSMATKIAKNSAATVVLLTSKDPSAKLFASFEPDLLSIEDDKEVKDLDKSTGPTAALMFDSIKMEEAREMQKENDDLKLFIRVCPGEKRKRDFNYKLLTYSTENQLYIQDGETLSLPIPLEASQEITYLIEDNLRDDITVNVFCDFYKMGVEAKLQSSDSHKHKTYFMKDLNTNALRISSSVVKELNAKSLTFKVSNLEVQEGGHDYNFGEYDISRRIQVQVATSHKELLAGEFVADQTTQKGVFKYYIAKKRRSEKGLLYLKVAYGEADLYVLKGRDSYPTLSNFLYRSNSIKNDELLLPAEENKTEEAMDEEEEIYIVGVYSIEPSKYVLQYKESMDFDFTKLIDDSVFQLKTQANKPMYILLNRKKYDQFTFGFSGLETKPKVSYKANNELVSDSFEKRLPSEKDKTVEGEFPGHMTRIELGFGDDHPDLTEYVLKIETPKDDLLTTFVSTGPNIPLELPSGLWFSDFMDEKICRSYKFNYATHVIGEKLEINVLSGEVSLTISEDDPIFSIRPVTKEMVTLRASFMQANKIFNINDLFENKDSLNKPMMSYYLRLCSLSKDTEYSMRANTPVSSYEKLLPSLRTVIEPKGEKEKIYFYGIDETVNLLRLKVLLSSNNELSSLTQSKEEILQKLLWNFEFSFSSNEDFGFGGAGGDKVSVLNAEISNSELVDYENSQQFLLLTFRIQRGYFFLKRKGKSEGNQPITVELLINNIKMLASQGTSVVPLKEGESSKLELINPPNKASSIKIALCKGAVNVEVYDPDIKSKFSLSTDNIFLNMVSGGEETYQTVSKKAPYVTILNVKNTEIKNPADSFVAVQVRSHNEATLSLDDYFNHYQGKSPDDETRFFNLYMDEYSFTLESNPVVPAEGFDKAFGFFDEAEIRYRLVTKNMLEPSISQLCGITNNLRNGEKKFYDNIQAVKVVKKNGKLAWPEKKVIFKDVWLNRESEESVFATIQIEISFRNTQTSARDSLVLKKSSFEVEHNLLDNPKKTLTVFLVVLGLLAIVFFYLVFSHKKSQYSSLPVGVVGGPAANKPPPVNVNTELKFEKPSEEEDSASSGRTNAIETAENYEMQDLGKEYENRDVNETL